jgi:hypothetical protein
MFLALSDFQRANNKSVVLDSSISLPSNLRTDFDPIQPKWFVEVKILSINFKMRKILLSSLF